MTKSTPERIWVVAVVWQGVLTVVEAYDSYAKARSRRKELRGSGYYEPEEDDLLLLKVVINERDEAA